MAQYQHPYFDLGEYIIPNQIMTSDFEILSPTLDIKETTTAM